MWFCLNALVASLPAIPPITLNTLVIAYSVATGKIDILSMLILELCHIVKFSVHDDPDVFWGVVESHLGLGKEP